MLQVPVLGPLPSAILTQVGVEACFLTNSLQVLGDASTSAPGTSASTASLAAPQPQALARAPAEVLALLVPGVWSGQLSTLLMP